MYFVCFSYPNYVFISDNVISKTAGLGSRYTDASLRGVILDIHLYRTVCYVCFSYPNYVFISDNEISKTAGLGSRYTDASLRGVILDIHFLSLCDYLVCTFSSQVSYL